MPHPFNFTQGDKLSRIGAAWFVSYCYDDIVPAQLGNWNLIKSTPFRINTYNRTKCWVVDGFGVLVARCSSYNQAQGVLAANPTYERLHKYWMRQILGMNSKRISRNSIGLSYTQACRLALICLPLL